jgi:hypothetical protein
MVAQVAREYEGKVQFLTSPGLDSEKAMEQAVDESRGPDSMTHSINRDGSLWERLEVRYRGAWIFLDDGEVSFRSGPTSLRKRFGLASKS